MRLLRSRAGRARSRLAVVIPALVVALCAIVGPFLPDPGADPCVAAVSSDGPPFAC